LATIYRSHLSQIPVDRRSTISLEVVLTNTVRQGDCLLWIGKRSRGSEYPAFYINPIEWIAAHRLVVELTKGEIPPGYYACHRCDRPLCVNPEHLFIGTPADNARDMVVKGRWKTGSGLEQFQRKALCPRGHQLTLRRNGRQRCDPCKAAYQRRWYQRRRKTA
jgi:hypothetical protein